VLRPGFEPGSPARKGYRVNNDPLLRWRDLREKFLVYAKRYATETAKTMIYYLDRYVDVLRDPIDVMKLFEGLTAGQQHHLNRSLRALFNLCEILGFDKTWLDSLRAAIPKDRIGIDVRVPEESEILMSMRKVTRLATKYNALWNLCLDSGMRLIEAVNLINLFDPKKLQRINGFYRYQVGKFRGSKQAYYAYFTEHTFNLIKNVNDVIKRGTASHTYSKANITNPKYLRKFAFDRMIDLGIPESVADFIEGRVPRRIGAKHYMILMRQADRFYRRYAEYLKSLRSKL